MQGSGVLLPLRKVFGHRSQGYLRYRPRDWQKLNHAASKIVASGGRAAELREMVSFSRRQHSEHIPYSVRGVWVSWL